MQMSFAPPLFVALIERLAGAHRANVERRMSVQVLGLADTVRKAKAAIDAAGGAATKLKASAEAVVSTIGVVTDMTAQLDAANRDLTDAVSVMSNGGPPLDSTATSAPTSPPAASPVNASAAPVTAPPVTTPPVTTPPVVATPAADIPTSIAAVQNANSASAAGVAAAPPVTTYVAPPVHTASTIAAANAAAAQALLDGTAVQGAAGSV